MLQCVYFTTCQSYVSRTRLSLVSLLARASQNALAALKTNSLLSPSPSWVTGIETRMVNGASEDSEVVALSKIEMR